MDNENVVDVVKIEVEGEDKSATSTLDKVLTKLERIKNVGLSGGTQDIGSRVVTSDSVSKLDKFRQKLSEIKSRMKTVSTTATSAGSKIKQAFSDSAVGRFANKVKRTISSIGRIAIYRIMRTMISQVTGAFKTGIDDMYQYSKTFNGNYARSMDQLASANLSYKNSIGAIMAPIINLVVPWLDKVIDKLIDINNTVAMVIAGLTGKSTYSKAVRVTTEYAEAANKASDNTAKVKDRVEELKRSLAGLDEITIIGNNNTSPLSSSTSGSDGVTNGIDYGSMFVETPVDMAKVEEFKHKLEEILKIAELIGLAILGWKFTKALAGLTGLKSALTLSGIVLTLIGATLIFDGIKNVVTSGMDWEQFWKLFFGTGALTAGTSVLGGVISKMFGGNVLKGVGTGARVGLGAGGASLLFSGLFDTHNNTYDNGKGSYASTIQSALSSALGGAAIGTAVAPGVGTLIGGALGEIIWGIDYIISNPDTVKNSLERYKVIFEQSGLTGVVEDQKEVFRLNLEELGWSEESAETWSNLATAPTLALAKAWDAVKKTWEGVSGWWDTNITQPLKSQFDNVWGNISRNASNTYTIVSALWITISSWWDTNITQPLKKQFDGVWENTKTGAKSAWENVKTVWNVVTGWWDTNITQPLKKQFDGIWSGIEKDLSTLWKKIKLVFAFGVNIVISIIETGINQMLSGVNWFIDKFNSIGQWAANVTGQNFYFVQEIQPVSLGRVQAYKDGGFPEDGFFYANHNELVGQFSNGKTAVANNEQIVEGISEGVSSANEETNRLLRENNHLMRQLLAKDSTIDVSTIASAFNRKNQRDGKVTVPVSV